MAEKKKREKSKTKHKVTKKYQYYKIEGNSLKRERNFCPKCGPGVFLGVRKNGEKKIYYCGCCFLSQERKE